jgi:hypothetical protein
MNNYRRKDKGNFGILTVNTVVRDFFRRNGLEERYYEYNAVLICKNILGKEICDQTESIKISSGVLFIKTRSSALKNDLKYREEELRKTINTTLNREVLKAVGII